MIEEFPPWELLKDHKSRRSTLTFEDRYHNVRDYIILHDEVPFFPPMLRLRFPFSRSLPSEIMIVVVIKSSRFGIIKKIRKFFNYAV